MGTAIKVEGLQEFIDKIDDKGEVKAALNTGVKKVVFFMKAEVLPFVPVDKGFLRNSFDQKFGNLTGRLFNTRKYSTPVHEGHKQEPGRFVPAIGARLVKNFVKGTPFMTLAVKKSGKDANKIMNRALEKTLTILQ